MRFRLFCFTILYALSCFIPQALAEDAGFEDDISLEWLLGEEFKTPQKKRAEMRQKQAEKKKQEAKKNEEKNKPKSLSQSLANSTKSATPAAKKQKLPQAQKSPLSQNAAAIKAKYANVDFITKIRKGIPIDTEEMESWIVNTPDVNQCFENGHTMLLYYIARYKETEPLNLLIENGADIQTHCTPRYEALFIAAINNPSAAITELLIANGANVVDRDFEKNTALILAATFNSSPAVINILLDYGLKTNTVNKYGYDALMLAAYENGRLPIIQTLLDNEADVNAKDPQGHTPLMAAAIKGRDEVMKYLITRGADYKAVDNNGLSVLDYYNKRHYLKTLDFKTDELISPSDRLSQEFEFIANNHHYYDTMLKDGIASTDAEKIVAEALSNLADVDVKDENECTPLLNAARLDKSLNVIEQLVEAKADTNAKCLDEQNALMFLSAHASDTNKVEEHIEKAQYLIEHGLDINATDQKGNTALMYAVANDADNKYILNLINLGADVNAVNTHGDTALWMVVRGENRADTLKLLLKHGADVNQQDARRETPLWYQLHTEGNDRITLTLLRGGADANVANGAGETPLWYAFTNNASFDVVEAIITKTDDVNTKDENGDTPLLYAVKKDYPATIIKALFDRGANPEIADRDGFTMYDVMQGSQFFDETMQKRTHQRVLDDWEN